MAGFRIEGNTSGNVVEVDAANNLKVTTAKDAAHIGGQLLFGQINDGSITGTPEIAVMQVDDNGRALVGQDILLDTETFDYTAQNTGKHGYLTTTMTAAWTVGAFQTNSGSITTINTGVTLSTYAMWPVIGSATTAVEIEGGWSAQPATNTTIDFGLFLKGAATPYAPTDGVYFRLSSAGLQGVINYNGSETTTSIFPISSTNPAAWVYNNNQKYKFEILINERDVDFLIDGVFYGSLATQAGQGQPFASAALPFSVRHAIGGTAASGAIQFLMTDYTIRVSGPNIYKSFSEMGNAMYGSYQGMSGGTMGTLANYANSANPTTAAGSNTAANVTGLGGQGAITAAAAAATDFIMCSYQVPAGTISIQGRRLIVRGVKISLANLGAAVATTATTVACSLAFGHTAVSLATAEAAAAKAPRRIPLGMAYWNVGAPIGATPQNGDIYMPFTNPVIVNPGEFIATTMKFLAGTATASQSIWYHVTFDYGWE